MCVHIAVILADINMYVGEGTAELSAFQAFVSEECIYGT